ncbi:TIGR04197 family type VII secretion effector [Bacillus albus]|uniref:TIGR04197 family type VII secretion effector n=1 Tax=Bacillus TaxID=1386 RepID=UPI001419295D|nr:MULTISPECIES: TIGR04197 family type VII secretion effector [Bacillus]MBU5215585.1 TIGR04197 family type VII secretion effector [Bacillus albus]MDA2028683.1 TIGR04197 family type VII secretion effector [Bacillus cereus group sp. Bcc03]MDA2262763.1 TIGR04197 family type VII secretion effector [Bacillus cereus group sp. Bc200]MDA2322511.1 TIGR04197 family type VII secretion effector [Bacillus cereus group sp. Bc177]MDA2711875.1 TIGR04197 family type VII secretion effector [Bacillus cereus grou
MGEIKLNKGVFDAKVSELKSSASDLGKTKFNGMQLSRTNLTRLTQFCEAIEMLSQKVQQYEQLLENDLNNIQQAGEKIVEQDEQLEKSLSSIPGH